MKCRRQVDDLIGSFVELDPAPCQLVLEVVFQLGRRNVDELVVLACRDVEGPAQAQLVGREPQSLPQERHRQVQVP